MIFLDTSVALAVLFDERRKPPHALWQQELYASRLMEFEIWTRAANYASRRDFRQSVDFLLSAVVIIEITPDKVERLYSPFQVPLRTLDAIHISTAHYLRANNVPVSLASYDARMNAAASALGIPLYDLQ